MNKRLKKKAQAYKGLTYKRRICMMQEIINDQKSRLEALEKPWWKKVLHG